MHDITIDSIEHSLFKFVMQCSCGVKLYALTPEQADEHKEWHLMQVKREEARSNGK